MIPTRRFYMALVAVVLLLGSGYAWAPLFGVGQGALLLLAALFLADGLLLYRCRGIRASRQCGDRFSNGDDNAVRIRVESNYPSPVRVEVVDEVPFVFQLRDLSFRFLLAAKEGKTLTYHLRPTRRGVCGFGRIRLFVTTRLNLVARRYTCGEPCEVKVYPSFLMLHRYELLAIGDDLTELGIKRIRRIGHHTEFEQIKEYVRGDDYRTINWKASARRHELMVNVYQDERSQQIYNIIDKGRMMQRAFRGMTLLDYAINASLVLSYIAMRKEDKAGLVSFDQQFDTFVPASRRPGHIQTLLESLYNQQTAFGETDFSALCTGLNRYVGKRSLLVLYTDFSGVGSLNRQLVYLKQLNRRHRLLVVFFEDADLKGYLSTPARDTEAYYQHVIAGKFVFEQRLIVSTLKQHGIYSLLTTPENLSVDVINKYLEMKNRQLF